MNENSGVWSYWIGRVHHENPSENPNLQSYPNGEIISCFIPRKNEFFEQSEKDIQRILKKSKSKSRKVQAQRYNEVITLTTANYDINFIKNLYEPAHHCIVYVFIVTALSHEDKSALNSSSIGLALKKIYNEVKEDRSIDLSKEGKDILDNTCGLVLHHAHQRRRGARTGIERRVDKKTGEHRENSESTSKVELVTAEIVSAKQNVGQAIGAAIDRGEHLEDLALQSQDLLDSGAVFHRQARGLRRHFLFQKWKTYAVLAAIILVIIGFLAFIIWLSTK